MSRDLRIVLRDPESVDQFVRCLQSLKDSANDAWMGAGSLEEIFALRERRKLAEELLNFQPSKSS